MPIRDLSPDEKILPLQPRSKFRDLRPEEKVISLKPPSLLSRLRATIANIPAPSEESRIGGDIFGTAGIEDVSQPVEQAKPVEGSFLENLIRGYPKEAIRDLPLVLKESAKLYSRLLPEPQPALEAIQRVFTRPEDVEQAPMEKRLETILGGGPGSRGLAGAAGRIAGLASVPFSLFAPRAVTELVGAGLEKGGELLEEKTLETTGSPVAASAAGLIPDVAMLASIPLAHQAFRSVKGRPPRSRREIVKAIREEPAFVEALKEERAKAKRMVPRAETQPPEVQASAVQAAKAPETYQEPAPTRDYAKTEQQDPEHFDKGKIIKQVEKGGEVSAPDIALTKETAPAKQPWEMTKQEWAESKYKDWLEHDTPAKALDRKKHPKLYPTPTVEIWLRDPMDHKAEVKSAIYRGENIPPEVLAGYPDLRRITESPTQVKLSTEGAETVKFSARTGLENLSDTELRRMLAGGTREEVNLAHREYTHRQETAKIAPGTTISPTAIGEQLPSPEVLPAAKLQAVVGGIEGMRAPISESTVEPQNVAAQRTIGPTERRTQMEQAIADGENRLRTRKNAIGERLSGKEIAATRKAVMQAKVDLTAASGKEPLTREKIVRPPRERIATEDQSVASFLENSGGISIQKSPKEAGELRARRESAKGKRMIKAKTGMTVDEVAQKLNEAGFIDDPSASALWEVLDSEIEGKPVFSVKGANAERRFELQGEREVTAGFEAQMAKDAGAKAAREEYDRQQDAAREIAERDQELDRQHVERVKRAEEEASQARIAAGTEPLMEIVIADRLKGEPGESAVIKDGIVNFLRDRQEKGRGAVAFGPDELIDTSGKYKLEIGPDGKARVTKTQDLSKAGYERNLENILDPNNKTTKEYASYNQKAGEAADAIRIERERLATEAETVRVAEAEKHRRAIQRAEDYYRTLAEEAKELKLTKGKIDLLIGQHGKDRKVPFAAQLSEHFAINRHFEIDKETGVAEQAKGKGAGGLAITHRGTGMSLGLYPKNLEQAKQWVRALEREGIDWNFTDQKGASQDSIKRGRIVAAALNAREAPIFDKPETPTTVKPKERSTEIKPRDQAKVETEAAAVEPTEAKPEEILGVEKEVQSDISLTKEAKPRVEPTEAGMQGVLAETPQRTVPKTGLKPKARQTERLTPLEEAEVGQREAQGELLTTIKKPEVGPAPDLSTVSLADLVKKGLGEETGQVGNLTPEQQAGVHQARQARQEIYRRVNKYAEESGKTILDSAHELGMSPETAIRISRQYQEQKQNPEVVYAQRSGVPVSNVEQVKPGDIVYDRLLEQYAWVKEGGGKDSVRLASGVDQWNAGIGNRLETARQVSNAELIKKGLGSEIGTVGKLTPEQQALEAEARAARKEIYRRLSVEVAKTGESLEAVAERMKLPPGSLQRIQASRGFVASIKNVAVDKELADMGLPPATHGERISFEDARASAERMVQIDPFAGKKLVDDLVREPRPVTATEDALLLTEQTRLKNERIQAEDALVVAQKTGDQIAIREAKARVEAATADFMTLSDVVTKVGTQSSLSLGHRRMMMKEDYSLAAMERAKQVAKDGKSLTEAERAEIKTLYEKITATQKAFDEYMVKVEVRQAEIESELVHSRLLAEAKEKPTVEIDPAIRSLVERVVVSMETQADAARTRLREKLNRLHAGLDPTIIADASIIGAAKIARTGLEVTRWSKAMIEDLGEKIIPYLEAVWDASKKRLESTVERMTGRMKEPVARVIKGTDLAEQHGAAKEQLRAKVEGGQDISPQAQTLARLFVEQGIKERNALIDAVHGELKEVMPDITRRQVMDAISGYGRYRQLSKDEISVELRDLKGQMQQVAKLEDIQSREPPLKTGVERRVPSDEERRLIQQVNEAKRRFGVAVTDPATQLQSALGARKTYYRNQISDLEAQIVAKEKFVKERTVSPIDPELESLRTRRNELKEEFDKIFGTPGLTDQQRAAMAIRGVAKSITDLEQRIKTGDIAPRMRVSKTPSTPELEAMRARQDALREQLQELRDAVTPKKTPEQIALQSLKTRLKNQTADLTDKLARGDFTKRPKRTVEMTPKAQRLAFENAKVRQQYHEGLIKDRLAHRTVPQKIIGGVSEVLNVSRAILTGLDLSAVLRQGGFTAFAHPIRAAKAFPAMFRALLSEKGQHKVNQEILSRENYPLYKRSKLYLAEHGQTLSQMEEAYMSRWAEKIPLVGASQRAYTTFLNRLRADSFDAMARSLGRSGEITPEEGSAIANFINVSTGRGNLGMRENAAVGLNTVFFAPRYVASRFQLIAGQPFYRGTVRTRTLIAREYARTLIGLGIVYGLAEMSGAEIETDPRSSDFGKIKIGNTRIDPLSGLSQTSVLLSRLATGETKTLRRGRVIPIRGEKVPYGGENAADVIARFLRSKLSPVVGTTVNVLAGEDVVGDPVTPESVAMNLAVPLAMQDIYDAMVEQGVPKGTALGILATFGMGLQTFDERKRKRPERRTFGQRLEGLGERLGIIESGPVGKPQGFEFEEAGVAP